MMMFPDVILKIIETKLLRMLKQGNQTVSENIYPSSWILTSKIAWFYHDRYKWDYTC